jgi:hypothetical protein
VPSANQDFSLSRRNTSHQRISEYTSMPCKFMFLSQSVVECSELLRGEERIETTGFQDGECLILAFGLDTAGERRLLDQRVLKPTPLRGKTPPLRL